MKSCKCPSVYACALLLSYFAGLINRTASGSRSVVAGQILGPRWAILIVWVSSICLNVSARAATVTWGAGGAGGSGNWDATTANWFDGSQNVLWPSGGDAIFTGTAGGAVSASTFTPVVA